MNAKRIVVLCVTTSALLATVQPITKKDIPSVRIAVGAMVLAVILLVLAEATPELATAFSFLLLLSTVLAVGPETFETLSRAGGHDPKKK